MTELRSPNSEPVTTNTTAHVDTTRPALPPAVPAPAPVEGKTAEQYAEAARRLNLVETYRALMAEGLTPNKAVERMAASGIVASRATLDRWNQRFGHYGFEGLLDNREQRGRKPNIQLLPKEKASLRARRLGINRTETDGSTPEAVRACIRHGELRPEIAAEFLERDRTGRMVPESIHNEIAASEAVTKQFRNPTDAALDYLNAPGSMMWLTDELTGEERRVCAGDILEADDATINFPVCVPWEIGGDKCSEKFGVKVARFQWLVAIDRASRFVPGWNYIMRPRSSYRAEDILTLFNGIFRTHGVWKRLCLERGIWESNLVSGLLNNLGITRVTAWSPHQKPFIEGLFNLMWSKLSEMPGQVGRFRGEQEKENDLITSCQKGATDPRLHFPMITPALKALGQAIDERNAQPVKTRNNGTWVPQERWLAQIQEARQKRRLRPLAPESAWMFAPCAREWTVKGNCVGGSVQLMEGYSVRFDFAAEWLTEFHGCEVNVHFDAFAPRCEATLVLAQNARGHSKGEVLGNAVQVNKDARYARRVLGYGDDADMGYQIRQQAAKVLRSEVRTVKAGGETGISITTLRNADGDSLRIERGDGSPAPAATPETPTPISETRSARRDNVRDIVEALRPDTQEEFKARQDRQARLKAARERIANAAAQSA